MTQTLFFKISSLSHLDEALDELQALGLETPCIVEDLLTDTALISGQAIRPLEPKWSLPIETPAIDWQAQWNLEGEALLTLDLAPYGGQRSLLLQPGAGFGDLSHPTTQLTLELMAPHIQGASLIDVGCGSGILSLAGLLLGAQKAYGLEICPEAREHARDNADLNGLSTLFTIEETLKKLPPHPLIVMNMIASEQGIAWKANPLLSQAKGLLITSGVLTAHREEYLRWIGELGWRCIKSKESSEWSAFLFKYSEPQANH